MLGYTVNALELSARMEGMEQLLHKYLGESGYFSSSYMKQMFDIPKLRRGKRSVDKKNDKYASFDEEVS